MAGGARDERRAAVDTRFSELEGEVSWLRVGQASLKRKLDDVVKCQTYVVEGADALDTLFQEKCGDGVAPKKWRELKEGWATPC